LKGNILNSAYSAVKLSLMPTLDDVYRKFGFASEAAQLLETELGTMLLHLNAVDEGLLSTPNPERATAIYETINRSTLGQIIQKLKSNGQSIDGLDELANLLSDALVERNRLSHSFYRQHNLRRNSEEGRALMMADLDSIHTKLLDAYKAVMLFSGIDLDDPTAMVDALKFIGLVQLIFSPRKSDESKVAIDHLPI
jgi:hypothetical protein